MENNAHLSKILVVEDHPSTRKLLVDILKREYDVICSDNGEDALKIVHEQPDIDLILLDIIMPGIDGYEVCKILKESPSTKDIPIIFLTVMNEEKDEKKGFDLGVADYIIKPVSRMRLAVRVKNQLKIKKQHEMLQNKNAELQEAMDQIKALRGILPICSFCKQIRNDHGYWQQVDEYIQSHTEVSFSHSVCPKCIKEHYSEYNISDKE